MQQMDGIAKILLIFLSINSLMAERERTVLAGQTISTVGHGSPWMEIKVRVTRLTFTTVPLIFNSLKVTILTLFCCLVQRYFIFSRSVRFLTESEAGEAVSFGYR